MPAEARPAGPAAASGRYGSGSRRSRAIGDDPGPGLLVLGAVEYLSLGPEPLSLVEDEQFGICGPVGQVQVPRRMLGRSGERGDHDAVAQSGSDQ